MNPRCICGHGSGSHLRDLTTGEDSGRCCRGHYGAFGRWQAEGCACRKFRLEGTAQTDMLDELLADAEPPPTQ